ncbi:MAG: LD-carboxypeptidase [Myxococcota bacterium]|nr:LD-carboxypeptidase [Myxococcota bacterium]
MSLQLTTPKPARAAARKPVVRIVHPAGALAGHEARLEAGCTLLEKHGCRVRWEPQRMRSVWRDYYAGDDMTRAEEFIAAVQEPGVDIVWMARGGSGCGRITERICKALSQVEPRIVIGFSDGTAILNALAQHLGWITFHGPVVTSLADQKITSNLDDCLAIIQGHKTTIGFDTASLERMQGRLFGGNLTVLASTIGQPYGTIPMGRNAICLLEDVGEAPYRLERAFCQLRNGGILEDLSGLLIGDLDLEFSSLESVTAGFAADSDLPMATGAPAGHRGRLSCLPIGGEVYVDAGLGTITGASPWVLPT